MRRVNTEIKQGADNLTIEAVSSLYNYRAVAAVRENISNAIDAHTEAGQPDPIEVALNYTNGSLEVVVADTGIGMSEHEVENDYLSIEVSRKRSNDDLIGGHGVGVLSTFAATDTMTVVTTKDGTTTTAQGVNHGFGDIEWTISALDEPLDHAGTTVSFTMDVTEDEARAVMTYIVMLTYLHNIRLTIFNQSSDRAPLDLWVENLHRCKSGMLVSHDTSHSVVHPHSLLEHPENNRCSFDTDFLLGHKTGLIGVPHMGHAELPSDFIMPVIGGLPYRMGVTEILRNSQSRSMVEEGYVFMATEKWIENSPLRDLHVTAIPRNREYAEVDSTSFVARDVVSAAFLNHMFDVEAAEEKIPAIVEENMDYIAENLPAVYREVEFSHIVFALVERAVAASLGATNLRITDEYVAQADAFSTVSCLALSLSLSSRIPSPETYSLPARMILEAIYMYLRDTTPRASMGSANSALNWEIVRLARAATQDTANLSMGSVLEIMLTLAHDNRQKAKYATRFDRDKSAADHDFIESLIPVVCTDLPDTTKPWDKDTCSAVASHLGRKANIVVAFEDPSTQDFARVRLFNYLASTYATRHSRISGGTAFFYNNLSPLDLASLAVAGVGYMPNAVADYTSFDELTTAVKREKKEREWAFKRIDLAADGSYTVEDTTLTTDQGRKEAEKDTVLLAPASGHTRIVEKETGRLLGYNKRPWSWDTQSRSVEVSALYKAGFRHVYVYNEKNSSVLSKLARTHWVSAWMTYALTALEDRDRDEQAFLLRKNIACTFFRRVNPIAAVPAYGDLTHHLAALIVTTFRAARKTDLIPEISRQLSALLEVHSPFYRELALKALEKNPEIPREFVLPYYAEGAEEYSDRNPYMYDKEFIASALKAYTPQTGQAVAECEDSYDNRRRNTHASQLNITWNGDTLARVYTAFNELLQGGGIVCHNTTTEIIDERLWLQPGDDDSPRIELFKDTYQHKACLIAVEGLFEELVVTAWERFIEGIYLHQNLGIYRTMTVENLPDVAREVYATIGAKEFVPEFNAVEN